MDKRLIHLILLASLSVFSQPGLAQEFRYDASGRLIETRYTSTNSLVYGYDPSGNLTNSSVSRSLPDQDSDHDGMPDAWELVYFNTLTNTATGDFNRDGRNNRAEYLDSTDPTNPDSDSDGLSNLSELMAGTNPLDPDSHLGITQGGWNQGGGFVLRWQSVSGKRYRVEQSSDLLPASFAALWTNILATPPLNVVTDHTALIDFPRFYRIRLEP
jgi:YD repeat-containing protein